MAHAANKALFYDLESWVKAGAVQAPPPVFPRHCGVLHLDSELLVFREPDQRGRRSPEVKGHSTHHAKVVKPLQGTHRNANAVLRRLLRHGFRQEHCARKDQQLWSACANTDLLGRSSEMHNVDALSPSQFDSLRARHGLIRSELVMDLLALSSSWSCSLCSALLRAAQVH